MSPVVERSQLVERDGAKNGVALIVVGHGHITRNLEIFRRGVCCMFPMLASVGGVGNIRWHLVGHHHLLWIDGIHRHRWFTRISRIGETSVTTACGARGNAAWVCGVRRNCGAKHGDCGSPATAKSQKILHSPLKSKLLHHDIASPPQSAVFVPFEEYALAAQDHSNRSIS